MIQEDETHPPLNAPTGLRTGSGTASASVRDETWNDRVVRMLAEGEARIACAKMRDAIVEVVEVMQLE